MLRGMRKAHKHRYHPVFTLAGLLMQSLKQFPIHGTVQPGFERVREVFERNFTHGVDVGASFCVTRDGEALVDLWGGFLDRDCTRPWGERTLVNLYSTTKGLGSIAFAWAVENSELEYEHAVSRYWPELVAAQNGLTIGQLLSHQGGLCGLDETITVADLYDWDGMIARLSAQEPHWQPGTAAGYHAMVWGFLAGELVRRVTGRMLGEIFRDEIAGPLGADCHIGLGDELHDEVADMIGPNHARIPPDLEAFISMEMPDLYPVALQNPSVHPYRDASSAPWRRAEIAAANGHGNARGIAQIYADLVSQAPTLLNPDTVAALTHEEVGGQDDLVLGRPLRRGRGVILNTQGEYGPNERSFGHTGAGGSAGLADPDARIGVGFAMNQMQMNLNDDTRLGRLLNALYESL